MPISNPSHTGVPGGANRQFLSDLSLLNERSYPEFIKIYPNIVRKNYIVTREAQGGSKFTPNKRFFEWQAKGKSIPSFRITANATALAGVEITVTVAAGFYEGGGTKSAVAAGHYYRNSTTGQLYKVMSVNTATANAHTAVLRISKAAQVPLVTAATDLLIWDAPVVGEKSGTQEGLYNGMEKVEGSCATIKTSKECTDWNLFEKTDLPGGQEAWKSLQDADQVDKFTYAQERLLMFGEAMDNIPGVLNTHVGLLPKTILAGQNVAPAAVSANYFKNIRRLVDSEGYSKEYDALLSLEARMKWEDYFQTMGTAGSFRYLGEDAFKGGAAEININFDAINMNGLKINMTTYDHFSNANVAGAAIQSGQWVNGVLLIPRGEGIDPESGVNIPRFKVRHQARTEQDRAIKIRATGGWSANETDDVEHLVISHVTTKGIETFGMNGFMYAPTT